MRKCRSLLVVALAMGLILLAGGLIPLRLEPPPGVTESNAKRIRPGMTREHVEVILGGRGATTRMHNAGRDWVVAWFGKEGTVRVWFTASDTEAEANTLRVTEATFRRHQKTDRLHRLRARFGR